MRERHGTFALGVDIGQRRVRVALTRRGGNRSGALLAVATRPIESGPAEALDEAVRELGTRERRCVLALAAPDAELATLTLPAMAPAERHRAAAYEASRRNELGDDAQLSMTRLADGRWVLGVARRSLLAARLALVRATRLRPIAVDDAALALRRVHDDADAVVDVGAARTVVSVLGGELPRSTWIPVGGDALTEAIADALGISPPLAERRKQTDGFGGAGDARRDAFVAEIVTALERLARPDLAVRTVVMCGNGSRAPGLADALARAAGCSVRLASLAPSLSDRLPADVLRAAGPDWSLAVGLALWETA